MTMHRRPLRKEDQVIDVETEPDHGKRSPRAKSLPRKANPYAILGIKKENAVKRGRRGSSRAKKIRIALDANMEDGTRLPNVLDNDVASTVVAEQNGKKNCSNGRASIMTEGTGSSDTPAAPSINRDNHEDIEMDGNCRSPETDYIGQACKTNKVLLTCSYCGERGTLASNGNTLSNRKTA